MPPRAKRKTRAPRRLGAATRRELLQASWMTHDAMWFAASVRLCGIGRTNLAARAAARSAAEIEAQRLCNALGLPRVRGFAELKRFLREALGSMRAPRMRFGVSFPAPNVMRWKASRCFAHDCATRLGVIADYQCGVFERLEGWLETLGVAARAAPAVEGCLMHARGACAREYRFSFEPGSRTRPDGCSRARRDSGPGQNTLRTSRSAG
ncbi:MAG: hypothetical protein M0015_00350 [Betaproteobacteria bacterium]|nr:hypothetical protein [Betaproteobacteria bacterium]